MKELLDVVNEKDEVIETVERGTQQAEGKMFRMIFVMFYTSDGRLIFQKRNMKKKSNPGKLTTTVSGHVESGMSFDDTVVKETREETGLELDVRDFKPIGIFAEDQMRAVYAYRFNGDVEDLQVEEDEGDGFVVISLSEFKQAMKQNDDRFTYFMVTKAGHAMFEQIEKEVGYQL